ncbi:MAG: hypothetical protein OEX11_09885 [Nitrosomonas sp.]|nr:hypothetical protein [Nitrosomonas sp.]
MKGYEHTYLGDYYATHIYLASSIGLHFDEHVLLIVFSRAIVLVAVELTSLPITYT